MRDYIFFLCLFLSHALFFQFSQASGGPVSHFEKSVWRYEYGGGGHRGTGFFIDEKRFIAGFHVFLGNDFLDDILQNEKAVQNIRLSQEGNSSVLKAKRILRISGTRDLILLEIEGRVSNYLSLGDRSLLMSQEGLFVFSYPQGFFRRMTGLGDYLYGDSYYEEDYFYSLPVNYSAPGGLNGSPVLDGKGEVVGMVSEGEGNHLRVIKPSHLSAFVQNRRGLNCLSFKGAGACIKAEEENLKKWADKNTVIQYILARMYRKKSKILALYWFQKSAELGYAPAQYMLGRAYHKGEGRGLSIPKALYWYQRSAEQGYAPAQYMLGEAYYKGEGVDLSFKEAFQWLEKASEQNYAKAQCVLGVMYQEGKGTERSLEWAFYWFQKSAFQGDAHAQYLLAGMYDMGRGVKRSLKQAFYWYKRAAKQAHAKAEYELARMYYYGYGTERDIERAMFWYAKAAERGLLLPSH